MATAYEVSFHVRTDGSGTAIQDVLTRTLHGTDEISKPTVIRSGDEYPVLLVSMTVNANDSSEAGLAARTALDEALRDAGLTQDAITVDAPEIRTGS